MTAQNLVKDQTIHEVLKQLRDRFGDDAFSVSDNWDADLFAIGIARPDNPGVLAYISTFNLSSTGYFVELETPVIPQSDDDLSYQVAGRYKVVDFEQVALLIANHLRLAERNAR